MRILERLVTDLINSLRGSRSITLHAVVYLPCLRSIKYVPTRMAPAGKLKPGLNLKGCRDLLQHLPLLRPLA
jgi:hypothetical protein